MTVYETHFHIGPDAKLILSMPREYANQDVRVVVEAAPSSYGRFPPGTRMPPRVLTLEEWRTELEATDGSVPDFPNVERPAPTG